LVFWWTMEFFFDIYKHCERCQYCVIMGVDFSSDFEQKSKTWAYCMAKEEQCPYFLELKLMGQKRPTAEKISWKKTSQMFAGGIVGISKSSTCNRTKEQQNTVTRFAQ